MLDQIFHFYSLKARKNKGLGTHLLSFPLKILSLVYRLVLLFRNMLYDKGWMRQYYPPVPLVISVGNIAAGGTGKTPVVQMLARAFQSDFSVAILSRGYKSPASKSSIPLFLNRGTGVCYPASYCGDEPYLLSSNLPNAMVLVGKDRCKSSFLAAKAGARVIIMDDGLQHRKLARDYDLIVLDGSNPFHQHQYLPFGYLRDNPQSLSRAKLVIVNHVYDDATYEQVVTQVSKYTSAKVIGARIVISDIIKSNGEIMTSIAGRKVGIFCGIANPASFETTLREVDIKIVDKLSFRDHAHLSTRSLQKFAKYCSEKGAEYLLCTEKDFVKLENVQEEFFIPLAYVKIDLKMTHGEEYWKAFLSQANESLRHY